MSKIFKGTTELIGNTPLVEAVNIEKSEGLEASILLNFVSNTRKPSSEGV